MRTIIAGSRNLGILEVAKAMAICGWVPSLVISGTARGVDRAGEQWAREHGIPILRMPADWERYGKRAGMIRNAAMADNAEALVAVWDGVSRGTENMILEARRRNLRVFVFDISHPHLGASQQ